MKKRNEFYVGSENGEEVAVIAISRNADGIFRVAGALSRLIDSEHLPIDFQVATEPVREHRISLGRLSTGV